MKLQLKILEKTIKEKIPSFELRFKDKSIFMRMIGFVLFFSKNFLKQHVTTIKYKVYFPNMEQYYKYNYSDSFKMLAHEFVHLWDYKRYKLLFIVGYLFPQILAIFTLILQIFLLPLILKGYLSLWWLMALCGILFILPFPAYFRTIIELRGYGMNILIEKWENNAISQEYIEDMIKIFSSSNYYFMWPFENYIRKKLIKYAKEEINLNKKKNMPYRVVKQIIQDLRNF